MRETQDRFFREVFSVPAGLGSQMRTQGSGPLGRHGIALPWSNYIVLSRASMVTLARFNVLQAAWLDLTFPREATRVTSRREGCPSSYRTLQREGIVSVGAKDESCAYCAAPVFTNWHRCRVGCHRCWSYIMEQLNVFYYHFLTRLVYVHDDRHCAQPFAWAQPRTALHDFTPRFINAVYEEMLARAAVT